MLNEAKIQEARDKFSDVLADDAEDRDSELIYEVLCWVLGDRDAEGIYEYLPE